MLLDYVAIYPNVKVRFYASDMQLHVDSDAANLVQPHARCHYAGYFYQNSSTSTQGCLSGAVHVTCRTIRNRVASATKAETGGLFFNAQNAITIKRTLETLGHRRKLTPWKTDNSTANSFVYGNIKQRKSKSWDMRYNWLRDKETHQDVRIYWGKGSNNHANYFTKHQTPITSPDDSLYIYITWTPTLVIACARVCFSYDGYKRLAHPMTYH